MGRQLSRQKCIHESLHLSSRMDQVMGRGQCNLRAEGQKNLRSSMPGQSFQNNELKFIGRPCLKNIYISWGSIKKRHSDFNLGFHVSTTQQISNKHEKKKKHYQNVLTEKNKNTRGAQVHGNTTFKHQQRKKNDYNYNIL